MKRITKSQFEKAERTSSKAGEIVSAIKSLETGHGVEVTKEEFKDTGISTYLPAYIHQYFRPSRTDKKFKVRLNIDKTGWLILRTK